MKQSTITKQKQLKKIKEKKERNINKKKINEVIYKI